MNRTQPGAGAAHGPPAPAPLPGRRKRPFGLYMILILLTLQGLLGAVLAILFGLGVAVAPGEMLDAVGPLLADLIVPFALMLITLVVAVGLWRYKPWGWYGMMLLLAYWMATDAIGYFTGKPDYVSMVLNVAMVFYLNQRDLRDLFERQRVEVQP